MSKEEKFPEWLNEKFLSEVLEQEQNGLEEQVLVLSYNAESAVPPGNNYLSRLYRVRVQYKTSVHVQAPTKTYTLMIKVPTIFKFMEESSENEFFEREPIIYNNLLPKFQELECCEFGPRCFKIQLKNVLVMNDLKEEGYIMIDKTKQLNFLQCVAVVVKLAKFHAASVFSFDTDKDLAGYISKESFFYTEGSALDSIVMIALENLVNNVSADKEHARLADFIRGRFDQIWPNCIQLRKPKTNKGFNVLNHGDLWTNNILFKYSNCGTIEDVKFVDFQHTAFSSPMNDLVYFIWCSANEEVRAKRQDELFVIYLETLNKTLTDLGSGRRYTEQELREDLTGSVDLVLFSIAYLMPLMFSCAEDALDFENVSEEEIENGNFKMVYKGSSYMKVLPAYLKQLTEEFLNKNVRSVT